MGCSPNKNRRSYAFSKKPDEYKVVLLGNTAVGKTSILKRYCLGSFQEEYEVSIGGSFQQKVITFPDKSTVTLNIWDTAGQERFKTLMPLYYRDAQAALIVFDLTNVESLASCNYWFNELKKSRGEDCQLMLVGNKLDCPSQQVSAADVEPLLRQHNMEYFETSAKTNTNIEAMFTKVAADISQHFR
jgi:small GTP-binding protein